MSTTEVVVLLDGDEVARCSCGAPMFASHSMYYATEEFYYTRFEIECGNGHIRTQVDRPQPLTDEIRDLLDVPEE